MATVTSDALPRVEVNDLFIKQWGSGGQQQFSLLFHSSQRVHIQRVLAHQAPDPIAFTAILLSLVSSVLLPSAPSSWPSTVAAFLSEALDKTSLLTATDSASIAQTAVVDALWVQCQPLPLTSPSLAPPLGFPLLLPCPSVADVFVLCWATSPLLLSSQGCSWRRENLLRRIASSLSAVSSSSAPHHPYTPPPFFQQRLPLTCVLPAFPAVLLPSPGPSCPFAC